MKIGRRGFLKGLAGLGAVAALPAPASAEPVKPAVVEPTAAEVAEATWQAEVQTVTRQRKPEWVEVGQSRVEVYVGNPRHPEWAWLRLRAISIDLRSEMPFEVRDGTIAFSADSMDWSRRSARTVCEVECYAVPGLTLQGFLRDGIIVRLVTRDGTVSLAGRITQWESSSCVGALSTIHLNILCDKTAEIDGMACRRS